jgi:DNA mismatch repair protein MutL
VPALGARGKGLYRSDVPQIAVLSDALASQIAAGEVVERPSSALKELLENAMDAGATRCGIEIEGGGITRLAVLDDGCGMSEEDARLSLQRHATSKLRAFSDLEQLTSYGFRGEALPSIASVSRLTIRTRRSDAASGVELTLEGGLDARVRPVGCAPGTLVEVRDLFFNVPARRKFLRSTGTESGHLTETVEALALANPRLAMTLKRDGRLIRQWLRVNDRQERALGAFDEELTECRGERGPLRVEAYLTRPERARAGAGGLRILVNGRPIRDRALAVAAAQAYGSVLERGRYPRGVVYLELPPQLVDFNVHPQKLELRFADPRAVCDALYQVLASQLARGFSLPTPARRPPPIADGHAGGEPRTTTHDSDAQEPASDSLAVQRLESPRAAWSRASTPQARGAYSISSRPSESADAHSAGAVSLGPELSAPAHPDAATGTAERDAATEQYPARPEAHAASFSGEHVEWAGLSFLAQVRHTYLVCEGPSGLYVIDQHAAAERVTFDRIRRQYRSRSVASQALLFPVEVQLSAEEAEFLEARAGEFAALGLDLRLRGAQWVSVHGVPRLLERASPERLLRDLLAETLRHGGRDFSAAVDLALATLACHASLRAGDALSGEAARALLEALDGADFAGHCPHGRPIVAFTPWSELERKVGRR